MIALSPKAVARLCKFHRTGYDADRAAAAVEADAAKLADIIRPHIKSKRNVQYVLDIGCGIGLASLGVFGVLGNKASYYLLDKDEVDDKPKGKYHKSADSFGASGCLDIAHDMLKSAGFHQVFTHDVVHDGWPKRTKTSNMLSFDVIISTLSCGFHYPVATYATQIRKSIRASGIVVLDIRKEALDEAITAMGSTPFIMHEFGKHFTCIWRGSDVRA